MKKIYPLYIFVTALLLIGYFFACEKINIAPEWGSVYHVRAVDDSTNAPFIDSSSRAGDGYCTIVFLGTKKRGSYTNSLFLKDVDSAKAAIMATAPFRGRNNIRFYAKKINGDLGCHDDVTGSNNVETIGCDQTKVINAARGVTSNQIDIIVVLASAYGHGSFDGTIICAIGLGSHAPGPTCTFEQASYHGKLMKEIGRRFNLAQQDTVGSKMNSGTSGGCDIWYFPFTQSEQAIIASQLDFM